MKQTQVNMSDLIVMMKECNSIEELRNRLYQEDYAIDMPKDNRTIIL